MKIYDFSVVVVYKKPKELFWKLEHFNEVWKADKFATKKIKEGYDVEFNRLTVDRCGCLKRG